MTRVKFTSRQAAIRAIETQDLTGCNVISISSTYNDYSKMCYLLKSKLEQKHASCFLFIDVDSAESGFTPITAEFIVDRVTHWLTAPHSQRPAEILVHCDMGVSRSGAVAKWINDYFGLDQHDLNDYNLYNSYVYSKLMDACGVGLNKWYKEGGQL